MTTVRAVSKAVRRKRKIIAHNRRSIGWAIIKVTVELMSRSVDNSSIVLGHFTKTVLT